MKKVRKKKWVGGALNLIGTTIQSATQAITANKQINAQREELATQQRIARQQMDLQREMMNQQNSMAFVNSMNQAYNKDMSGNYNKYQPVLKLGGKRVKVKNLSKYKSRF